jgi:N-acetyltransferase
MFTTREWIARLEGLVPIEGSTVRLEALTTSHHADLCAAGLDDELWRWTVSTVRTADDMAAYIDDALTMRAAYAAFPFVIIARESGRVAGSTRFGNIDSANRRLEIGWTWLAPEFQRTAVNTETKYLLLRTAFEQLGCVRVEFKTDVLNEQSRRALERLGAKEEGVLRQHMITATGRLRDSIYFSIIDGEWPTVKRALEGRLPSAAGASRSAASAESPASSSLT